MYACSSNKMSAKKIVRSTNDQIHYMIKYMTANPAFANHKNTNPAEWKRIEEQWESLRTALKSYGPDKSTHQWKQTWRDLKRKYKINLNDTSGKDNGETSMSDDFTENNTTETLNSNEDATSLEGTMDSQNGKFNYSEDVEKEHFDWSDFIKKSKTKRTHVLCTNTQINILLDYMAAHHSFANGLLRDHLGIAKMQHQWQYLWETLKEYGPEKSIVQWKQTWRDLKKKARREHEENISAMEKGRYAPPISNLSLKVLEIMGHSYMELESDSDLEPEISMDRTLPEPPNSNVKCDIEKEQHFPQTGNRLKQRKHGYYDLLDFAITQKSAQSEKSAQSDQSAQSDKSGPPKVKKLKLEVDEYDTDHSSNIQDPLYEDNSQMEDETQEEGTEIVPQITTVLGDHESEPIVKYVRNPDEFEALGISIAAKVRRMDDEQKIHAELLIQKVLAKGLLGQLNENIELVDLTSARLQNHPVEDMSNTAY
ncbi:uncharacterized protein [Epargyreus clarus]|uniref:uncharacterized protein n=1 Tax=Epargyreus clarus TaxID=520877 RepID=UPI003C2F854A